MCTLHRTIPSAGRRSRVRNPPGSAAGSTFGLLRKTQAAMWLEHLARSSAPVAPYPLPFANGELDYEPLLHQLNVHECARSFHGAIVQGMLEIAGAFEYEHVVISGGVFQNALLVSDLREALGERLWTNRVTPANDGGICLGQAAIAAFR